MFLVEETTPTAYAKIIERLRHRKERGSRAGEIKEDIGTTVVSDDPQERYVDRDGSWNLAFQLQEHWAYWAGANPGHVQRYNTQMEEWMVDGELPGSAYGDRLRNTVGHDQIQRAISQLEDNPETRRAMMMVHQPGVENYDGGDVACTAYLHPFIRDGQLNMVATLRSQDMYWGYTYDAANNQFIQEAMAQVLGVDVGSYQHVMDSCHYYTDFEDDVDASAWTAEPMSGVKLSLPDWRSWSEEFDALTHGLKMARLGDSESIMNAINMLESEFCRDWLQVIGAYELERFHDDDGRVFADMVTAEGWNDWITGYCES